MISAIRYIAYVTARKLTSDEEGATATEYVFLLVFIALVIVGGATALGLAINGRFNGAATQVGP